MHYTQNFVLQTPFGGKLFKYTQLFITIRKSYSFYHFFHKYRPLYMTEATLNANNNIYICSIFSSKLHILMYDRIKNMYTQNQRSIPLSCVWEVFHNIPFEEPSYRVVCVPFLNCKLFISVSCSMLYKFSEHAVDHAEIVCIVVWYLYCFTVWQINNFCLLKKCNIWQSKLCLIYRVFSEVI